MSTRYEVSYKNMWPSDELNERVRDDYAQLLRCSDAATACRVWIDRATGGGLAVRVELDTVAGKIFAVRSLKVAKNYEAACAAIDAAFNELGRRTPSQSAAA